MKIRKLETIWFEEQFNTLWLRIHTDEGLIGLGETYYVPRAVAAVIHDVFANLLVGRSVFDIEKPLEQHVRHSEFLRLCRRGDARDFDG